MLEKRMTEEKVKELFSQGFHCSQVVMKHMAVRVGLDEDEAVLISGALGGGCFKGGTCGVISAGSVVLSKVYGYNKPNSADQNAILVSKVREFQDRFSALNDKLLCKELLGADFSDPEDEKRIWKEAIPMKFCLKYVKDACDILDDMLDEDKK